MVPPNETRTGPQRGASIATSGPAAHVFGGDEAGFTLVEVLVSVLVMVIGLFGLLTLIDTGNATTAKNVKRDTANALLREVAERTQGLTYSQLTAATAPTARDTLRTQMTAAGSTTAAIVGSSDAFDVTRGATTYRVAITRSTTTSTTCGTADAPRGTILVLGPGACNYPTGGPIYHGPIGEASGCKVGVAQSPTDVSSGALGLQLFILNSISANVCTASLLGTATANAVCSLVGSSAAVKALLEGLAGRDGLLNLAGDNTLGLNVDLCSQSGTPGYVANPPVINLAGASTTGPETGITQATLTVSWRSGAQQNGTPVTSQVQQSTLIRQSTVAGES